MFGGHTMQCQEYSWLCIQGLLLMVLRRPYGLLEIECPPHCIVTSDCIFNSEVHSSWTCNLSQSPPLLSGLLHTLGHLPGSSRHSDSLCSLQSGLKVPPVYVPLCTQYLLKILQHQIVHKLYTIFIDYSSANVQCSEAPPSSLLGNHSQEDYGVLGMHVRPPGYLSP